MCGIGVLIGNSIILYTTWLMAFFQGNRVTVLINNYGEMPTEFVFFPISLVIAFWSVYQLMFNVKFKRRNGEEACKNG